MSGCDECKDARLGTLANAGAGIRGEWFDVVGFHNGSALSRCLPEQHPSMNTTLSEQAGVLTDLPSADESRVLTHLSAMPFADSERAAPTADGSPRPRFRKTIRVLHVINGQHYSGAERVQDLLAARLPDEGFDVALACVKPDKFPRLRQATDAPLIDLTMRTKFDVRAAWKLARIVRREEFRILHAHTPRTAMIASLAAAWTSVPLVYHVHSPTSCDSTRPFANWLNQLIERRSIRRAARLITVSASLGRHMRKQGFPADRISVVPNGVPGNHAVAPRDTPRDRWTLGTVALFRPRKGTEVLLDALATLRGKGWPVSLRAIGPFETADYERKLKDQVARLGIGDAVCWTGFTRDVNAELAKIDLFVLPSLFGEGLPMVVLEAMAAGIPVVGTKIEGVPEAIRDGIDGVLAKPNDANDLAEAIGGIVQGKLDWQALRRSAMRRHAERFSDHSMAAGVAEAYRRVLASVGG